MYLIFPNKCDKNVVLYINVFWSNISTVTVMLSTLSFLSVLFSAASSSLLSRDVSTADCNIGGGEAVGEISDPIHEASGLAVSRKNPGILFTQPDSGHGAHVWAVGQGGSIKAEIVLEECTNHDWEDVAVTGTHVYVADTGNNGYNRNNLRVLRFPEPNIDQNSYNQIRIKRSDIEYLDFTYPDESRDCEGVAVDPDTNDIYFFSKHWHNHQSEVYRYPWSLRQEGKSMKLEYITTLPLLTVTGADISPSGNTLAITNLWEGFSYTKPDGMSWKDYLKDNAYSYCSLKLQAMQQIEAIAVTEEGYYSTSECSKCPIWYYRNN